MTYRSNKPGRSSARAWPDRAGGLWVIVVSLLLGEATSAAQDAADLPSIEKRTARMKKLDGFLPLYWHESKGELWMEISRFDTEILYLTGLGAGLGSNDIGLDRGRISGSRVVKFERVGRKVLMVQPNYRFRATSDNAAEVRAVRDAFARSVLWGFAAAAETDGRVLVDLTGFLMRDASGYGERLGPGSYRLDATRSSVYRKSTENFPKNTELEVELTFVRQAGDGGSRGGRGYFEGVGSVAATSSAATLREHHSFVELPSGGYVPRAYDPRAGYGAIFYQDYAAPLGTSMTKRFIRRHRLEKRDPAAERSPAVRPIVYYLDRGVPEPIRSALLDGARWWNQAFEAAGYINAFQVKLLPEGVSPLDVRYNVINWVHRSTRGWSYGNSVIDPRTGEILKGAVALGSLRVRQDYLIAEGLLSPYRRGDETPPELAEWALARIRQLSAHEVGHTLGLSHNYYDSRAGRISVMDYPHPLIELNDDGTFDFSRVYDVGIGAWDRVAIAYGYQDFPSGTDEAAAFEHFLDHAWDRDIRFLTNQDIRVNPKADQWSNGNDPAVELRRMMKVRRVALERFGENAIKSGRPLATLEEVLVPLYLHHRYQVDAAASALGGVHYTYTVRGDGREPFHRVPAEEQLDALSALIETLEPEALALPRSILEKLPPRPAGYPRHRELFPRNTGSVFDAVTPAVVAANHTVSAILDEERATRLVEQKALDGSLPGLDDVLDRLFRSVSPREGESGYEGAVRRAVERVIVDRVLLLAERADMPHVRAVASMRLQLRLGQTLRRPGDVYSKAEVAHYAELRRDVERFLKRAIEATAPPTSPPAPPGAPIGEPAMEWLQPWCCLEG